MRLKDASCDAECCCPSCDDEMLRVLSMGAQEYCRWLSDRDSRFRSASAPRAASEEEEDMSRFRVSTPKPDLPPAPPDMNTLMARDRSEVAARTASRTSTPDPDALRREMRAASGPARPVSFERFNQLVRAGR